MNLLKISKNTFRKVRKIDGWLNFDAVLSTATLINIQWCYLDNEKIVSLEIGVHHGKYFIAFNSLYQTIYPLKKVLSYALDLFEHQEFNLDKSGKGNKEIFSSHIKKYLLTSSKVKLITGDSTKIEAHMIGDLKSIHFASIDGGHHYDCVLNDLKLVSLLMAEGGIISLDDFYHPGWVSVSVAQLQNDDVTLIPLILAGGKLFLVKDTSKSKDIYKYYLRKICNEFNISGPHSVNNIKLSGQLIETKLQPFLNKSIVYIASYNMNPIVRILRRLLRVLQS